MSEKVPRKRRGKSAMTPADIMAAEGTPRLYPHSADWSEPPAALSIVIPAGTLKAGDIVHLHGSGVLEWLGEDVVVVDDPYVHPPHRFEADQHGNCADCGDVPARPWHVDGVAEAAVYAAKTLPPGLAAVMGVRQSGAMPHDAEILTAPTLAAYFAAPGDGSETERAAFALLADPGNAEARAVIEGLGGPETNAWAALGAYDGANIAEAAGTRLDAHPPTEPFAVGEFVVVNDLLPADPFTRDHPTEAASGDYRAGYARGVADERIMLARRVHATEPLAIAPPREEQAVIAANREAQAYANGRGDALADPEAALRIYRAIHSGKVKIATWQREVLLSARGDEIGVVFRTPNAHGARYGRQDKPDDGTEAECRAWLEARAMAEGWAIVVEPKEGKR